MTSTLSKRQQARNERTLQELVKTVPGNNVCADCQARNPAWASWNLGIFICMRCAGLHRKLGTHISKVKSLSMDSWTTEQVENMRRMGNTASNRIYNPQNAKPPVSFDVDEADSTLERFLRQKYKDNALHGGGNVQPSTRHGTGSTESDDHPPPLPPKTGSRFGFRSASSIFPMSSKAKREAAARAYLESSREQGIDRRRSPSPPARKTSRAFGSTSASATARTENLDAKLAQLREMGFSDDKKNENILKGLNGNLEKAIETLVKLGEGSGSSSRSRTPMSAPGTVGLSIQRTREKASPNKNTNNPFDKPTPQSQSSQSTGAVGTRDLQVNGNSFSGQNENNPFGIVQSRSEQSLNQNYGLEQSFQNLGISQSQSLFPNHTGETPNRHSFYGSPAPLPMPSIPQGQYPSAMYETQQQYSPMMLNQNYNPFLQPQTSRSPSFAASPVDEFQSNPFGIQQRSQTFPVQQHVYYDQSQQPMYFNQNQQMQPPSPIQNQQNPYALQMQQGNPYSQQLQHSMQQPVQQPVQQLMQQPIQQPIQQLQQNQNPYALQIQQQQQLQQQQQQPQQQFSQYQSQQQFQPQQTGRADTSSIMALFNYPQLAPTPAYTIPQPAPSQSEIQSQPLPQPQFSAPPRSFSSPLASVGGSRNPFLSSPSNETPLSTKAFGSSGSGARHVSQDSMAAAVGSAAGWSLGGGGQNGRHSPDAFASLSARSVR